MNSSRHASRRFPEKLSLAIARKICKSQQKYIKNMSYASCETVWVSLNGEMQSPGWLNHYYEILPHWSVLDMYPYVTWREKFIFLITHSGSYKSVVSVSIRCRCQRESVLGGGGEGLLNAVSTNDPFIVSGLLLLRVRKEENEAFWRNSPNWIEIVFPIGSEKPKCLPPLDWIGYASYTFQLGQNTFLCVITRPLSLFSVIRKKNVLFWGNIWSHPYVYL